MEWISIKDGLPKGDSEYVDVHSKVQGRLIDCSYVESDYWETYHGDKIEDVTHWMPQPEPPNKDNS